MMKRIMLLIYTMLNLFYNRVILFYAALYFIEINFCNIVIHFLLIVRSIYRDAMNISYREYKGNILAK
jgi:hypothetical protein